ncbi:hypothetical protein Clacol_007121 [Clathrus columnatus]|uniref:F-box domain-containing protein n=1 Tax=Clathrus columnatus TaxID=1419009 RepID=A0AAV5AJ45_9AGAM|nr:hypothetical protein Clacol_007121 [Clathrus columnatus]
MSTSTQRITRFPLEILFLTIDAINDRNDLLSFALTCRSQVWTKLDRTALQKLSIRVKANLNTKSHQSVQANWVGNVLSDTPKLTHLSLTIQYSALNVILLDYTWPNLENLIINNHNILPTPVVLQPPSNLTDFFKRHPKLTTLSLPYNVYPPSTSPYITVECLPKLESFFYDGNLQFPLSLVLSPASARRLHHLSIRDNAVALGKNPKILDIYKELTSLQTFCFTLNPLAISYDNTNLNQILEVLAMHANELQKIHLPTFGIRLEKHYSAMLSILKRFPKLTHLSGAWTYNIRGHDTLLQELYQCRRLEYAINLRRDNTPRVFQLIREFVHEDKDKRWLVKVVSGKSPDFNRRAWGK